MNLSQKKKAENYSAVRDQLRLTLKDIEVPKGEKNRLVSQTISVWLCYGIIVLVSIIGFGLESWFVASSRAVIALGDGILVAKGCSLAIYFLIVMLMFFVSYDLITWMRTKVFGLRLVTLFDFGIAFHKFCGYLLLFYSVVHTFTHLYYTFPDIAAATTEKELEAVNHLLTHHKFTHIMTYADLLFTTWPGITGIIISTCIVLMTVCSLPKVRRVRYQCFANVHMICFPIFLIGTILHGNGTWLNFGYPTGVYFIPLPFLIYMIMIFRRAYHMRKDPFKVADVAFTNNN